MRRCLFISTGKHRKKKRKFSGKRPKGGVFSNPFQKLTKQAYEHKRRKLVRILARKLTKQASFSEADWTGGFRTQTKGEPDTDEEDQYRRPTPAFLRKAKLAFFTLLSPPMPRFVALCFFISNISRHLKLALFFRSVNFILLFDFHFLFV